jgi:hypothetical protein
MWIRKTVNLFPRVIVFRSVPHRVIYKKENAASILLGSEPHPLFHPRHGSADLSGFVQKCHGYATLLGRNSRTSRPQSYLAFSIVSTGRSKKGDGWLSWGGWVAKLLARPLATSAL